MTIRRTTLIAAIEAGIDAAPGLWEYERYELRKVGLEAETVSGSFNACPLTQAGLYGGGVTSESEDHWVFVLAYDKYLAEHGHPFVRSGTTVVRG